MRATSTVGICDESANGSSYIEASCGTTSSASPALTYSSVCEVPRCAATALACSASLKAGSSKPIENVLTACAADFCISTTTTDASMQNGRASCREKVCQ